MLISNPCPNLIKPIETNFLLLGYTKMKPYLGFISKSGATLVVSIVDALVKIYEC